MLHTLSLLAFSLGAPSAVAWAAPGDASSAGAPAGPVKDRTLPADEDYTTTPFTEYGVFNEDADEEAETKFMQFGRLFGVSLSIGQDSVLGNRGTLWQGGFPLITGELHYWFDFHLALDLGASYASHYYNSPIASEGYVSISFTRIYLNLRYYFDTKDMSAPLSFASPYVIAGFGEFNKTQNYQASGTSDSDSALGITGGAGLEFPIVVRSAYFDLQATIATATFKDTYNSPYTSTNGSDLSGAFVTVTGGFMFTW